jgi:hypothetical protein
MNITQGDNSFMAGAPMDTTSDFGASDFAAGAVAEGAAGVAAAGAGLAAGA